MGKSLQGFLGIEFHKAETPSTMCRNVLAMTKVHFRSQLSEELRGLNYLIPADAVNCVNYLRVTATIAVAVLSLDVGRAFWPGH